VVVPLNMGGGRTVNLRVADGDTAQVQVNQQNACTN
jgi:hypothetical protein